MKSMAAEQAGDQVLDVVSDKQAISPTSTASLQTLPR